MTTRKKNVQAVDEENGSVESAESDISVEKTIDSLIYCGPNLPNGLLNQYTVYRGGLPKHMDKQFKDCPAVKQLFVPVDDLAASMQAINTSGTAEKVWFDQVLSHFYGGVK